MMARRHVGKIFVVAVVLDALVVFRWLYPSEALLVATVLAILALPMRQGEMRKTP